jgi:DNA repair protein SbcD/Mre11
MNQLRLIHTSDWHLGKNLGNFSRLDEQESFLQEFLEICESKDPHLVLIAGDIFDTFNPPIKAQEIFYKYIKQISKNGERAVLVIAGNHDSPDRISAPYPLSMETGVILTGYPESELGDFSLPSGLKIRSIEKGILELVISGVSFPVYVLLTPYANESRLHEFLRPEDERRMAEILEYYWELKSKDIPPGGINILVSHLFAMQRNGEKPEESEDEKSIVSVGGAEIVFADQFPENFHYIALGHLHRYQIISQNPCPIVYSGSPLPYSIKEAEQKKFIVYAELGINQEIKLEPIFVKSGKALYRKRFQNSNQALEWLHANPDCYVEIILEAEEFLNSAEHRAIREAHNGIVQIIPDIKKSSVQTKWKERINLDQSMEELFSEYFAHKMGVKANDEMIKEFQDILKLEDQIDS